jgi:tricorn protease
VPIDSTDPRPAAAQPFRNQEAMLPCFRRAGALSPAALLVVLITLAAAPVGGQDGRPSFAEPGISADGREIAFVSGGDIWSVPASGGSARLLVAHAAAESRPLFSPDGRHLAFVSDRTGGGDIYLLELGGGAVRRLTFDSAPEQLEGWSPDGRWVYFSSAARDIAGMNDVFRVPVEGGTPTEVAADRYANEFDAAPAPGGDAVAIAARGISPGQWWRKGSSHIDEAEIWLVHPGTPPRYEQLTSGGARERWPLWGADGRTLYFVSDRGGAENIWVRPPAGSPRPVTAFTDGRLLWPSITRDGRTIAFERDFGIWTLDTGSGRAAEVPIERRGAVAGPVAERQVLTDRFRDLALSPDGRKVAFIARGEVFAGSAREAGDAFRVTRTTAAEYQPVWSPDSRRLVYVSEREGTARLFEYDFVTGRERRLTGGDAADHSPRFSPDGKQLGFIRGGRELRALNLATGVERLLATGYFERSPIVPDRTFAWSPDGQWIAYLATGAGLFRNAHVVPAAGGAARPVSFLANSFGNTISWSADGAYLLFTTTQRTEGGQLARVDLVRRTPTFREERFRDMFRDETPAATARGASAGAAEVRSPGRSPAFDFEDIRRRLSLLPTGVDAGYETVSPDGKTLLLIASAAGQQNLFTYSLDEAAPEAPVARQLTSTTGPKRDAHFAPDGKEVYFLEGGRIQIATVESRQVRPLALRAEVEVDFEAEKRDIFQQAWSWLDEHFYDPDFHGVDWQAVRAAYAPRVAGAATPEELRRLLSLMVGELNASHLGVRAPGGGGAQTGRLGLRFEPAEYEQHGRLRVREVLPLGPADVAGIRPGDRILALDGQAVGAGMSLEGLLEAKVGRRVELLVDGEGSRGGGRPVPVLPITLAAEKELLYRSWVEERRTYVERISGGRLGYVHMADMSAESLARLHLDLDAENHGRDGVVIDLRHNNGGFVNVYAIDVIARRGYLTMTPRGQPSAQARTVLGQRALQAPTILVVNQHSLSDAEDFTEGYRELGLGSVVGEPTAGWIIYTWNQPLLDGTVFRLPRMKVTDNRGRNMEREPRPVDVEVRRPMGESYAGRDSQLDAAVAELVRQIDEGRRAPAAGGDTRR